MFSFSKENLSGRCEQYRLCEAEKPLSFDRVANLWQNDESFRSFFVETLATTAFNAYRWETPPINSATLEREFEFVLLDCPMLDRRVDRSSFASVFINAPNAGVAVFENLGNDALLIVPCPASNDEQFAHLGGFLKYGSREQIHELWRQVGMNFLDQLSDQGSVDPVWLSTAGMGVAWVHIRLDSYPKYYGHTPYREWNSDHDLRT